jgi:phage-related protein
MPDDIVSTTYPVYYSARKSTSTRVLKMDYGDGYSQRAADGINTIRDTWEVEFRGTYSNMDSLQSILEGKAGHTYFTWTAPRGSTAEKWICTEWSRTNLGRDKDAISATFIQVFDL